MSEDCSVTETGTHVNKKATRYPAFPAGEAEQTFALFPDMDTASSSEIADAPATVAAGPALSQMQPMGDLSGRAQSGRDQESE
jgi:hypothetical protein